MLVARRGFITGLAELVAAPTIVRVASIMPVRALEEEFWTGGLYSVIPLLEVRQLDWERTVGLAWLSPEILRLQYIPTTSDA